MTEKNIKGKYTINEHEQKPSKPIESNYEDLLIKYDDDVQNSLIRIDKQNIKWDEISETGNTFIGKIKFDFLEKDNKFSPIRVGKLLFKALSCFTPQNDHNSYRDINDTIYINIEEYARECDVLTKENEYKKKTVLKSFRKTLKKDLIYIRRNINITVDYEDNKGFKDMGLFQETGIDPSGKYAICVFSKTYANKLLDSARLGRFSKKIFAIDARAPITFKLAIALTRQFTNYSNQKRKKNKKPTFDIRRIEPLIEEIGLQSIEEIREIRASWVQKAKKPFERSMNQLVEPYGILKEWHYLKKDGTLFTNEEYIKFFSDEELNYIDWINLKIQFTLANQDAYIETKTAKEYKQKELDILEEYYKD